MPRASREQARMNRHAIEEASSRLFRERGIQAVSIADLMEAVGLTPGGFYGHFASKDELAAIACNIAFDEAARHWRKRIQGKDKRKAFNAIVDAYLTRRNRDDPGDACPSATLASDVGRELADKPVCDAYRKGIMGQLDTLASLRDDKTADAALRNAIIQLALLVGGITLARASRGSGMSDKFLDVVGEFLKGFPWDAGEKPA
jgi:TetR/AcrR family transcriptional regulator, transcriptional repressor for nem operon